MRYDLERGLDWESVNVLDAPSDLGEEISKIVRDHSIPEENIINDYLLCTAVSLITGVLEHDTPNSNESHRVINKFSPYSMNVSSGHEFICSLKMVKLLKILYPTASMRYSDVLNHIIEHGEPVDDVPFAINLMGVYLNIISRPSENYNDGVPLAGSNVLKNIDVSSLIIKSTYEPDYALCALDIISDTYCMLLRLDREGDYDQQTKNVLTIFGSRDDFNNKKDAYDETLKFFFEKMKDASNKQVLKTIKERMGRGIGLINETDKNMENYLKLL